MVGGSLASLLGIHSDLFLFLFRFLTLALALSLFLSDFHFLRSLEICHPKSNGKDVDVLGIGEEKL